MMIKLTQADDGHAYPVIVNTEWIEMIQRAPTGTGSRVVMRDAVVDVTETPDQIGSMIDNQSEKPGSPANIHYIKSRNVGNSAALKKAFTAKKDWRNGL